MRFTLCGAIVLASVGTFSGEIPARAADFDVGQASRFSPSADFDLSWYTIDGGGVMRSTDASGEFELSGTIGQSDAGVMAGSGLELLGGFWGVALPSGTGVPSAQIVGALSRKNCDLAASGTALVEPRNGGLTELRIAFDVAPGGPGAGPVIVEQATCAAPGFIPYAGASAMMAALEGNELVLTFTPGLENARAYRVTIGPDVTSIAGQSVTVRALVGDVSSDGRTNATDRSLIVGVWTGSGYSCTTDITNDGRTNATDRSLAVGAWTGTQNCAP